MITINVANKFESGDIEYIKKFSMSSETNLDYALTKGFSYAAYNGQLEVIKYLLTSTDLSRNADIHHDSDYALTLSAYNGHLKLVKYLLTSKDLKEHATINARENSPLIWAAESNHLDVVRYLIESKELKQNADVNFVNNITGNNAFMSACNQGSLSVMKYLFKRKELDIEKALYLLNVDSKDGFMLSCENFEVDTDILDFIVFEMNFIPRKIHLKYFKNNENDNEICYAKKIIDVRNLNQKLNINLNNKIKTKNFKL